MHTVSFLYRSPTRVHTAIFTRHTHTENRNIEKSYLEFRLMDLPPFKCDLDILCKINHYLYMRFLENLLLYAIKLILFKTNIFHCFSF